MQFNDKVEQVGISRDMEIQEQGPRRSERLKHKKGTTWKPTKTSETMMATFATALLVANGTYAEPAKPLVDINTTIMTEQVKAKPLSRHDKHEN